MKLIVKLMFVVLIATIPSVGWAEIDCTSLEGQVCIDPTGFIGEINQCIKKPVARRLSFAGPLGNQGGNFILNAAAPQEKACLCYCEGEEEGGWGQYSPPDEAK